MNVKRLLRRLLTREITLVQFSDGDVFIVGHHAIPTKPPEIVRETLQARVWRWKRVGRG